MYLTNKYTKWYKNIVAKATKRVNQNEYLEAHHIIPDCFFINRSRKGTPGWIEGDPNDRNNIVFLTAKEHFICHRLLPKMTTGRAKISMAYAVWQMTMMSGRDRYVPTARTYETLKKQISESRKGVPISEEQKAKLRGPKTAEHRAKIGQYERTSEHKLAISLVRKAQIGLQTRSAETKAKMSAWQKGVAKPKVVCEYCKKETSLMNYKRWHGSKCKMSL